MKDYCLLVNSCDKYSDVWPLFLYALDEYFDTDIKVYINTETINHIDYSFDKLNINFLNFNESNWGSRLKNSLNSIQEKYVINLFDDYILESEVDLTKINEFISILESMDKLAAIYLNAVSLRYHEDIDNKKLRILRDLCEYKVNSAPAIWNRKFLIELTHDLDTPWSWEVFGTYRTFRTDFKFLSVNSVTNNIFNYDFKKGGAIYRGKWVESVVSEKIKKYDLKIDLHYRGLSAESSHESRKLLWKLKFIFLGFKTNKTNALWGFYFFFLNKLFK